MAKRSIITSKGLELLANSSKTTGQYYWLGYYSLAYVPNYWKTTNTALPACSPSGTTLADIVPEPISFNMTQLTERGDTIYNVFQGDLVGTGYNGKSDGSAGGNLFGLSMYDRNIKKHFRYALDGNGNNTLLAWANDTSTVSTIESGLMKGAAKFSGTNGFVKSELAIPAPLYYLGDQKLSNSDYLTNGDYGNSVVNGASIYLNDTFVYGNSINFKFPLVTADYRGYLDSQGNSYAQGAYNYPTNGSQFDSHEIVSYNLDHGFNETSWFASDATIKARDTLTEDSKFCKSLWKAHSISNYNRYHAPVDSIGHVLNSDLSTRNLAKTTKFFPISNYKVINSATGFISNDEMREVATSIALSIDLDLAPNTKGPGFDDSTFNFDENPNLTFFDKYDRSTGDNSIAQDAAFNTTHTSFKFNRIGIYAVPLMQAPYSLQSADDVTTGGKACQVQFQINPDIEPVLFSVVDFDNTVFMSDTGDGLHRFRADFNVNFDASGILDSELVRDSVIFYNMYTDDAQQWYQNQLIATASTQHAIMEFGLEIAHLKNRLAEQECCPAPNYDDRYALRNHNHDKTLRNLEDALNATNGGLKGIDTAPEGSLSDADFPTGYTLGIDSIVLGFDTRNGADYSYVFGYQNKILASSKYSVINAGKTNTIGSSLYALIGTGIDSSINGSNYSAITVGNGNSISSSHYNIVCAGKNNSISGGQGATSNGYHVILNGDSNDISNSMYSLVLNGNTNIISGTTNGIIAGTGNTISSSTYSVILNGTGNIVTYSNKSSILNGINNLIENTPCATIISGDSNTIKSTHTLVQVDNYSIILGGNGSIINGSINSLIYSTGGGAKIVNGTGNIIFGATSTIGYSNDINNDYLVENITNSCLYVAFIGSGNHALASTYSTIISTDCTISGSNFSGMIAGRDNSIDSSNGSIITGSISSSITQDCQYGFIGGGTNNILYAVSGSSIIGGNNNRIGRDNNNDIGGASYIGKLLPANYSTILGGIDCVATHFGEIAHSNGTMVVNDGQGVYDINNGGVGVWIPGPVKAFTKHSIFLLSQSINTFTSSDESTIEVVNDSSHYIIPTSDLNKNVILTLDGKHFTEIDDRDNAISNGVILEKGQSMSGTIKIMVHIPYSKASSYCDSGVDINTIEHPEYSSGATFYSIISFGAHRDLYGRMRVTSQLLSESCANIGNIPAASYGITTKIYPHAEDQLYDRGVSFVDNIGPGFVSNNYDKLDDIHTAATESENPTYNYRSNDPDGYNDISMLTGCSGLLMVSVSINTKSEDRLDMYSGRDVFCSAVMDVITICTPNAPIPPTQPSGIHT